VKAKRISQKFLGGVLIFLSLITVLPTILSAEWTTFDFSVLTWNISRVGDRQKEADAITFSHIDPLLNVGLIGIQEDFTHSLYDKITEYNYKIQPSAEIALQLGNGLSVFSDFKLTNTQKVKWNDCNGTVGCWNDCLADKGFVFTIIEIPILLPNGRTKIFPIHFYSLHLDAGDCEDPISGSDSLARELQLHQLHLFMNANSNGMPAIIVGDFNINDILPYNIDQNTLTLFMSDPPNGQGLTMANDGKNIAYDITNGNNKYDFILFRSGNDSSIKLEKDITIVTNTNQLGYKVLDYSPFGGSDHWPVWARFKFSVNSEIQVCSPNGGESWYRGGTYDIAWISSNITKVKIDLQKGTSSTPIASSVAASTGYGYYEWNIPATLAIGSDYKICISDAENPSVTDTSDANFTIYGCLPDIPVLKSPANNANICTTTPTFKWYAVTANPAVDYYQVRVNNANGTNLYTSANLTGTSFVMPANKLQSGTTYSWYVRAHNLVGWSDLIVGGARTLNIVNITVPAKPELLSPDNNAVVNTTTPTFKWGEALVVDCLAVDYYQVQINNANGTKFYTSAYLTDRSFTMPANKLQSGTTYSWYVRAHNLVGWSDWSGRIIIIQGTIGPS
jgi:hypothetical protein